MSLRRKYNLWDLYVRGMNYFSFYRSYEKKEQAQTNAKRYMQENRCNACMIVNSNIGEHHYIKNDN